MNSRIFLSAATAAFFVVLARPAAAQAGDAPDSADDARRILGITVTTSGTDRDTLGLLISAVTPDGPADRASIGAGSRLAGINGASLRIEPADVGRRQAQDGAVSRLSKELHALQPGDSATLRVFAGGKSRTVTIRTAKAPDVRPSAVARPATSLAAIADGLAELRAQLFKVIQEETVPARQDSLMRAQLDLGAIEAWLRGVPAAPRRESSSAEGVPGLRTVPVWDELASSLGPESRNGLLVVEVDTSWEPIRKGDVILRVNGELVDLDLLRSAADPRRQSQVDLLRGGRSLTVILHSPS